MLSARDGKQRRVAIRIDVSGGVTLERRNSAHKKTGAVRRWCADNRAGSAGRHVYQTRAAPGARSGRISRTAPRRNRLYTDLAYRWSNCSTVCGVLLAIASTLVPACVSICARVSAEVSLAKSASRMLLSLAVTFSSATLRLAVVV